MANPLLTDEQNRRLANQNSTYNKIMQGFAPVQQQQEDSFLGGLSRGAKAGFGGVGAGLLHAGQAMFGTDGSLAAGLDAMAENNAQRRDWDLADTFSLDYLTSPDGLAYGLGQIAGSMALPALVGAGVAAAAPTGGASLGALIGAAGAAPMAISEGGNTYAQGLQQGMTEEEAKKAGLIDAGIKLPFYMLSEGLSGKVAQSLISKGLLNAEGKSLGRRAAESGAKILGNAANEAYEEGTENRSSAYALGDKRISSLGNIFNPLDWNEEDKAQAVGVFTPTLALGALAGGAGHVRSRFNKKNNDVAEEIATEDGGTIEDTPEANVSGREAFINAIAGQESGGDYGAVNSRTGASGKYQIMPENWPAWAEEAGIGADAEMTPENQEIVARYKLGEYYDKYGARGAAIAWYAGEGALDYSEEALNRKQGKGDEPSINEYADSVLARMGNVADDARIDDSEENYFDEENYTDDTILDSLSPARGFDVSHLESGEAQDRNSLLYGEKNKSKKARPAPASEEVASFNQSLDNSNVQKAPNSLFVNSPRSWDAAERIYAARAKENAERKARAQAIVNIANAQQQSFLNVLRNRAAQQWDNAEQEYKDRKQDKLQSLANVINARAAQKWDAKEADNAQKAKAAQEKQAQVQNIARLLDARAAQQWDNAERDANLKQDQAQALANLLNAKAAGQYDAAQQVYAARAAEQTEKQRQQQAIANIINARAAQKFDEAETAEKFKFVPQRQSMYDGAMRRNLAAQDKVKQEEQPSVEPTERNGAALDKRNMLDVTLPKVREQQKLDKERREYRAERYGESALPQVQLLSTDRAARRNLPKPGIKARGFINDRAEKKSERERMQDAIAFVWSDDPKHPMKSCRRQLNMFRDMRKEYLQPIYDVMAEGAGNGVSRIPIIEFDNQHRGRFYRQSNNSPWYAKYFKEHKKKPTQKAMYDIAEEVAFGENADVGYYAGVQGKELEAIVAENHAQLDPINDYIQTYETLELRLKENPNYGKEQAERINKAEEERRAAKRNVGETASAKSIQTEAKQPAESPQDEVNKKAPALAEDKPKLEKSKEGYYIANTKDDVISILKPLVGQEFKNENNGDVVTIGSTGINKLVSNAATRKSIGNGYTLEEHNTAAANIVKLFKDSVLKQTHDDYKVGDGEHSNIKDIRIYQVDYAVNGKPFSGKITVKETVQHGKKLYSIELMEIEKPEGMLEQPPNNQQTTPASGLSTQSVAQPAENVKKLNLPKGTTVDVSIVGDNSNIIQVKFNGAQGKGTGSIMGRAGYKWKGNEKVWQARKTDKAMDVAEQLGYIEKTKPSADTFSKNPDALFNINALAGAPKQVTDIIQKMPKAEQSKPAKKQTVEKQETKEPATRFDGERARKSLDALIGRKKKGEPQKNDIVPKSKFMNVFNEDELDAEIEKAKKEMSKLSANPMFNPALMKSLFKVGGIYLQKGVNKFAAWADNMVDVMGEKVRPFLPAVWDSLKKYPDNQKFNDDVMTAVMEYVGEGVDNGKSLSAIKREFADDYGDEYLGYVDAAFEGVKKYPTSDNVVNVVESKQDNTEGGSKNGNDETRAGGVSENQQSEPVQGTESSGETGRVSGQSDEQYERQVQRPENEPAEKRPSTRGSDGAGSVSAHSGQGENSTGAAGRGTVPLTPAQKTDAKPSETPGHNYTVTKDSLGDGGVKTKYKNNVEAIKLLKQLEAEGRQATPVEQEVLANYVGWGGLSPVFNINYKGEAMDSSWTKEAKELKELLTDEEYKAARASTTTAFYTPVSVIKNIYGALERLGFKGGKILEPSMGTGNFFGVMPESMRSKSSLNGVELDPLTGRIAKQLYQKANVEITGFEKAKFPDNYFDLAISNVPFGSFRLDDAKYNKYNLNIHNYFFAKAMDKVRPGGLVCFVTSTDTMQGRGDSAKLRTLLKGKADLVGAIRLPDTTFKANANTEVTSDVIILQKRKDGAAPSKFTQDWLETVPSGVKDNYNNDLAINEYFKKHPEMVLGELKSGGRYGSLVVDGKGVNIDKAMQKAIKKLPADIYEARTTNRNTNSIESAQKFLAPNNSREGAFIEKDGKVYRVQQAEMTELPKATQKKAKEYVGLRDVAKKLLSEQINPATTEEQLAKTRAELNKAYDKFVEQYGPINDKKNIRALSLDPDYGILEAIEDYKIDPLTNKATVSKRAIFTKRTVNPVREVTHADNVNDALALSMSQTGGVDLGYMSKLMGGKDEGSLLKELGERVYENPATNEIELSEAYLSGNVREKLEIAETAAKTDERFKKNVEALKKIQPKDLEPEDISVSLGAPWIPASDIQYFVGHLLGKDTYRVMDIQYIPAVGTWKVNWAKSGYSYATQQVKNGVAATQTWGTKYKDVKDLLEAALNQSTPTVTHKDADGKTYTDKEETIAAQAKLREIQEEFKKWLWTDKERTNRLLAYYNRNFNNWVLRSYDGSALNFPGYSTAEPQLKQHQKDVVWRILQDGTCLMAHCVGAGKTWSMQTAAMELKRLGLANKSMFVIPNHMLQQFENEFRRIYPNAKLLTISSDTLPDVNIAGASKMSKAKLAERKAEKNAKRQSVLGKIATEDWDGIIISHNIFKRIPMSPEAYNRFYEQQIAEVEQAILDINATEGKSGNAIVKTLETTKKNLEAKLKKNVNEEAKDVVIPFEQLGVDQIFVDEADQFKNLYFTTKMRNIAGMSQANSQRSMDMFMKTQYLMNANNGRGVVFATGTPISNTMAEMFTMLRYLDNKGLKEKNLGFFDNWAATFATKETTAELSPDGSGYRTVEKFTKFNNMPELTKMFRKVADVKKIEDLDLEIPKLKNGKPTVVEIPMNSALESYIKETAKERATKIHNRAVDPQEDNMLKLTGDLRKASLDMRLVDASVPASVAGGKIKAVVEHVADKYKETSAVNGVQLVFCDLSTPKGASDKINESDTAEVKEEAEDNSNITVYAEIKKGLIKKGIPANQVAFIHDAKTKVQKEQLFERCRQGQVRVLIGSTEKMGAGTNIQKKLVAEHHVDAPWRPRDIEQREGRILRQGNDNKEVEIFNYVTKGSFDANMWEKLKNKATMIGQAMSGNLVQRSLEDADATVLSFAEVEALASGNPLMAERVMVNAKLTQMEALAESYRRDQEKNKRILATIPNNIKGAEANAEKAKADIANRKDISGDNFSMVMGRNKTVYTKRTDAKAELERIASHYTNELGGVVAKAGGFDIRFRAIPAGKLFMSNDGKTAYKAAENTVRAEIVGEDTYFCEPTLGSIEHAIMHAPDKALETANRIIASSKEEMKQLEAKVNEPFKYADEYEALKKRSAEIEEELNKSSEQTSNTQYSVSSEAVQRAREEVEAEIKAAFPNGKVEYVNGVPTITMPNGAKFQYSIRENIVVNAKEQKKADAAHGTSGARVQGFWKKFSGNGVQRMLAVSQNSERGTAFHEAMHAAADLALTEKEKNALYNYYQKQADKQGRDVNEVMADAYRDWVLARQRKSGTMFGKLWRKVKDFLNKLYTMFVEADNKGNIFRKLESGEAWKQQTYSVSEAPKFNITSADIKKFINVALKNPAKHLRMVLGKVSNAEAEAIKKATGMDVNNFTHVWFSEDVRHIKNRHGVGNEKDRRQVGLTQEDIEKAIDVIKSPDRIEKGATDKGRESIRFMKANNKGEYTVVEVVSNDKKQLAIKTMWNKKEAVTTKRHADKISPQYTSESGSGNTASINDTVSSNSQEVKYSVAPTQHKIANAFTNTERKGAIESAKDYLKEHRKSLYTDWVDKNNPLKGFDALTKATGGLSVYDQVQSLPATTAGMLKALTEGTAQHIAAANKHLKSVKMKHNVTLAMALEKIDKKKMDKAYPNYLAENGFNNWVDALGAYLGAERCLEMAQLARAEGKTYKFPKGLTEQECREFVKNVPAEFRAAADIFYKVNDNVISIMEDAEVFSHDLAKTLRTKYRKYCPLLRDFSDTAAADSFIGGLTEGGRGIGNVSVPLKRINIEGSERGVLNPLETILKSYAVMLNRAERNKVALMAVENSRTADLHELIQEVPGTTADPKNCVFTVLINGKKKAYKTTQDLYGPIVGYNLPAAGLMFGVARTAARMLRTGATMSPSFILRNVMRDTVFAGMASKNGFIPLVDTIRGAIALAKDPAMRAEFEAAGVTEFNFYSSQDARIKSLDAMAGANPVSVWEMMKAVFSRLEAASDFFESSTRMGEYMKARQKGLTMEEAARAAREVTLDFSRSGRVGEQVNQVVPFFNACLQGGDKMVRLFREDFVGTSLKAFKYIVLPSLLLLAMNWDEDWYKDLDPDIKNNYWCLGRNLRVPKPQEAGVLFGSGIEALFEQAAGKDKEAVGNWLKAFVSNIVPSVVPTLFLPILEWQANYSYFKGRQIVGSKYQRLPDELQYNDYTSELSKGIGSAAKISPMKIDNLVRGYLGTMGGLLWSLLGEPFAKAQNLPKKRTGELPFIRDFNVTDANLSRPMNEFYGILDKANRQHAGYGVKGKPEAAVKGIRTAGAMISKIRKDIDKITHSNLTPERKRELIDKRKEKMNQIAKQATARYGKYFE